QLADLVELLDEVAHALVEARAVAGLDRVEDVAVVVPAAEVDLDAGDALLDQLAGQEAAHAEAVLHAAVGLDDLRLLAADLEDGLEWRDGQVEALLVDAG